MDRFERLHRETISELNTQATLYRHIPTGAQILSMENDDENKCFGISFRTPPPNSTGVAHILEHTVLCGSRKYPVKDPFVQLLKGSLQTFLNAFTYPEKTCYPVASQNLKDFHNLVDVYLDAVFYPRITREFFMQEGWHYELESYDKPLSYKGVVYNEMKGACSSPESLLMDLSQHSLFPNSIYGFNSGGDPAIIPQLTHEEFLAFHRTYYHPSNARIFFYGDDPVEQRLALLEQYLNDYEAIDPNSTILPEPPLAQPVRIEKPYAVSADDESPKPMFTINWRLPEPTHAERVFALELLDHILLGTPASPLRKALIESEFGEDLTGGGLETQMLHMMYSIGLKGVEPDRLEEAQALVFDTLADLVKNGISREDIDAALNSFEFDLRENNTGDFPRGLSLMLKALNTWLYDANPLELIAFETPLQAVRQKASEPGFFEGLIDTLFVQNTHRSVVILHPDIGEAERIEAAEKERLDAARAQMDDTAIQQILTDTQHLLALQTEPDSEESLATIPLLQRSDLDRTIRTVNRHESCQHGAMVLTHDLFTNGILYFDLGFDLRRLEQEDLPYVTLLGSLLLEMGTQREDYATLSQRIAQQTGGIYGTPMIATHQESNESVVRFFLRGKCMLNKTDEMLDIYRDILLEPNLDHRERFRQIVLEHKSEMEAGLVPRGHQAVMTRLKTHYSEAARASELLGGVEGLFFIRRLAIEIEQDWPAVITRLKRIMTLLLDRHHLVINITTDPAALPTVREATDRLLEQLPIGPERPAINWELELPPRSEALTASTQVNFVGCGANLFEHGYTLHGSSMVITRYLQTAWLWEKIRVQGGAYGGMCSFDNRAGSFVFASYRDPNLLTSLETYRATGKFLKDLKLSEDELSRAIIGAIGQLDTYRLPDSKGYSSGLRRLTGLTDTERQQRRDEVLATTPEHFRDFGEVLERAFVDPNICILCSPAAARKSGVQTYTRVM